jgi:urease accessory protein
LAGTRASLIAGDDLELQIQVGAGAKLEVVEVAALVLHDTRGGSAAMRTRIELGPEATLVWLGEPIVVAKGCRAVRTTEASLGAASRLLLGERVVLGRAHELPGALLNRQRIVQAGQVVVDECLDTADLVAVSSPVVAGPSARMLAALMMLGERAPDGRDVMQLHLEGSMWRAVGASHMVTSAMTSLADEWRRALDVDVPGRSHQARTPSLG